MKINNLVEEIFSHAVALDQSGGLKNTIFAKGSEIFIINYDHTVLLHFRLRKSEGEFDHPISFKANDYDSNNFEEKDGKVIFTSEKGEYQRKKTCGVSDITPDEVKALYQKYIQDLDNRQEITLSKDVIELLDTDLSHIEFSGKKGSSIQMVQRNIYSGGIIEIEKNQTGFFKDSLKHNFGPIAIRTGDFQALFTFQNNLRFLFPGSDKNEDYLVIKSGDENKRNMTAIVACCLYDEIIQIKESKNGR